MSEAHYYNEIPFQLLERAGFPTDYHYLTHDQQRLIDFLIKDCASLLNKANALENENAILEDYIQENCEDL